MARIYGEIDSSALMTFDKSFSRSNGQPLDSTEVFYSLVAAEDYAKTDVAYISQKIAVVETKEDVTTVTHYSIEADGSLKELGCTPIGDGTTIEVVDGKITLVGLDDVTDTTKKYQPVLVDGKLTWQELSSVDISAVRSDLDEVIETVGDTEGGLVKDVADNKQSISDINAKIGEVTENKTIMDIIAEAQAAATYDDTALSGRVKTIEDDYLKSADKTELSTAISTAKTEAISEAVTRVLGEGVNEDFDTLKEVADWILSDTTGAASLITRISNIETDYLKEEDKTALEGEIDALSAYVGDIPEGATSTTVIAYIKEAIDGLKIGDYAKAEALNQLSNTVSEMKTKLDGIAEGAQVNVIDSVDETELSIDGDKKLSITGVAQDKITGLTNAAGNTDTLANLLDNKVDKNGTDRLITEDEAKKLADLVYDEDGKVTISGTVSAGNVDGLTDLLDEKVDKVDGMGLSANNFTNELLEKLNGIDSNAQVNTIEGITINGVDVELDENKKADIPFAAMNTSGVVTSSDVENKISVNETDGTMEVNSLNISKLVQTEGTVLILDGGSSSTTK